MNTSALASSHAALASARSFLFVPADRPERLPKALASGADAVIADLEDAVAPDAKAAARRHFCEALRACDAGQRSRLLLRINADGTPWQAEDLALAAALVAEGLSAVVCPKAESHDALRLAAQQLGARCALVPLIESAAGLAALDAIAASPQVLRLAFGHLDFQADVGLACEPDETELVPVRLALVLASRRAELAQPIDGVSPGTDDLARLAADAARARRGGFGAKLCIHPAQVATVHAAFTPSAAERDWAERVVAGFAAAQGGVFRLDGRMVDAPVVRLAERTLARVRSAG